MHCVTCKRGDPLTLRVFKLHRPSRPATLTPNNVDIPEYYDRQDLLTNAQNTSTLKPQHTTLSQHKNHFRHWSVPDNCNLESPITGQHQIYAILNVRTLTHTKKAKQTSLPLNRCSPRVERLWVNARGEAQLKTA